MEKPKLTLWELAHTADTMLRSKPTGSLNKVMSEEDSDLNRINKSASKPKGKLRALSKPLQPPSKHRYWASPAKPSSMLTSGQAAAARPRLPGAC